LLLKKISSTLGPIAGFPQVAGVTGHLDPHRDPGPGDSGLNYSANQALTEEEEKKELGSWSMFLTMSLAILIGLGLFVALPHGLSAFLGTISPYRFGLESLTFHIFRRPH